MESGTLLNNEPAANKTEFRRIRKCADYDSCKGHLTGNLPSFLSLNYFLWRLKTSTRQGVSFLLKSNAKFFDLIP